MCHRFCALVLLIISFSGCFNYSRNQIKQNPISERYTSECANVKIELEEFYLPGAESAKKIAIYKVKIINHSSAKLLIRYKNFKIITQKAGYTFNALPPYEIFGSSHKQMVVLPYPFPVHHQIEHFRFSVAPFSSRMYQELPVSNHLFTIDSSYYSMHFNKLAVSGISVERILEKIVPEGVVDTGGYISGYLYFEKIRSRNYLFQMELVEADSEKPIDIIQISVKKK
ncbi:MAG: hypothetical protein GX640_00500 [Fibrobacter sp.]|nr:hypothetical protein [Fibrobacter sp.]